MSLLFQSYPLARQLLFSLDAEKAHELTLASLQRAHDCRLTRPLLQAAPGGNESVQLMGLTLPNPVGLAAGLDKNGAHIDALGALGFGFVEVGTVTPLPQPGNPRPRLFRLPEAGALINRLGFNNQGLAAFLANVQASRWRHQGGILGLNIGKNAATPPNQAIDDYVTGLQAVHAHADYVVVNISSPNTAQLRDLQEREALDALLHRLRDTRETLAQAQGRRAPLVVKIAPDLTPEQIDDMTDQLLQHQVDGVIATNTTIARDAVAGLRHAQEAGGLSGPPVHAASLRVIERVRQRAGNAMAIIGVGGISQGRDAAEKIAAGANAVQLYTGLIYQGPALIGACRRAVAAAHRAG